MNNLAQLTLEYHKNAERHRFAKYLISGKMNKEHYATYLYNLYPQYNTLEMIANSLDLLDVSVSSRMFDDFVELALPDKPKTFVSTNNYVKYLDSIKDDSRAVMAHVYVRHMGDLSGGQLIAKRVPGKATMYEFDQDVAMLKAKIRARCDDSMAEEANRCFEFVTEFFAECSDEFDLE